MASTLIRRPLPALIALVALLALTGLVWWRVLHRGTSSDAAPAPCPTPTARATLPAPASVHVGVQNSTSRNGIGASTRRALIEDGFDIPSQAKNASRRVKIKGTAEISYGPKGKQGATLLRYYFPGANLRQTGGTSATVIVTLGAKYRRVASAASVQRSLAGDKVVVAGSTPTPQPSATC